MALIPCLAWSAGDPAAGEANAVACGACHGANGAATLPMYPNLAGQNERYLLRQMQMIKDGTRAAPLMAGQLNRFGDADLENLAAFYAAMPPVVGQSVEEGLAAGEQIYRGGILDKGVTACTACHSPFGGGNAPAGYPQIGGQPIDYTVAQLTEYREGRRETDEEYGGAMRDVAGRLTDGEIKALANYIQGLH
jgi:cytochrome c553